MAKKGGGKKKQPENHEVITIEGGPLGGQKMRMVRPCPDQIVLGLGSEVYERNGATSTFVYVGNRIPPEVIHVESCPGGGDCTCVFTSWLRRQDMRTVVQ